MKNDHTISNKVIKQYTTICQICEKKITGKTPNQTDKLHEQHYLFKHTDYFKNCVCGHSKGQHLEDNKMKCYRADSCKCKGFKEKKHE